MAKRVVIAGRGRAVAPVGGKRHPQRDHHVGGWDFGAAVIHLHDGRGGDTGTMARRWTPHEWEILFTALPPVHERQPSWDQLRKVGHSLDRSADALLAVWEDGERYLRGAAYGEASPGLRAYLHDRR